MATLLKAVDIWECHHLHIELFHLKNGATFCFAMHFSPKVLTHNEAVSALHLVLLLPTPSYVLQHYSYVDACTASLCYSIYVGVHCMWSAHMLQVIVRLYLAHSDHYNNNIIIYTQV